MGCGRGADGSWKNQYRGSGKSTSAVLLEVVIRTSRIFLCEWVCYRALLTTSRFFWHCLFVFAGKIDFVQLFVPSVGVRLEELEVERVLCCSTQENWGRQMGRGSRLQSGGLRAGKQRTGKVGAQALRYRRRMVEEMWMCKWIDLFEVGKKTQGSDPVSVQDCWSPCQPFLLPSQ